MSREDEIRQDFADLADTENRLAAVRGLTRSGRPEDPRTEPVVLLRFYDDDHGPCGEYKAGAGVTTFAVPAGADEVTADLVLPEPGGLAGATDSEVLFAAERLMQRYGNAEPNGPLLSLVRGYLIGLAERAREAGYPSPAEDARTSHAKRNKP